MWEQLASDRVKATQLGAHCQGCVMAQGATWPNGVSEARCNSVIHCLGTSGSLL
jgi:hypothetical protein